MHTRQTQLRHTATVAAINNIPTAAPIFTKGLLTELLGDGLEGSALELATVFWYPLLPGFVGFRERHFCRHIRKQDRYSVRMLDDIQHCLSSFQPRKNSCLQTDTIWVYVGISRSKDSGNDSTYMWEILPIPKSYCVKHKALCKNLCYHQICSRTYLLTGQ